MSTCSKICQVISCRASPSRVVPSHLSRGLLFARGQIRSQSEVSQQRDFPCAPHHHTVLPHCTHHTVQARQHSLVLTVIRQQDVDWLDVSVRNIAGVDVCYSQTNLPYTHDTQISGREIDGEIVTQTHKQI